MQKISIKRFNFPFSQTKSERIPIHRIFERESAFIMSKKASFGKLVDLPFDMISAVGTCAFKGIAATAASGAIKFIMI